MVTPRRPDPEPLETDDVRVVTIGTVVWFVALVLALVFHDPLADGGNENWTWIFLAGAGLGLLGIVYLRRRRRSLQRDVTSRDDERDTAPREPLT
ncbi:MAG: DUF2530 domain-containing protein [Actinomycetes bacterium]